MIEKELAQRVLIIGPDYRRPGGIATLLTHYKTMLVPFNFIATSQQVSKVRKFVVLLSALMKFLWIMCRKEITLIHIHTASNNDFRRHALFVYIGKLLGKRVILHIHSGDFEEFYHVHQRFADAVCHKADAIIAVSSYFADFFRNVRLSAHVYLLHNCIPAPTDREILSNPKKQDATLVLCYAGTINHDKGCFDVVDSIAAHKMELRGKLIYHLAGRGEKDDVDELNTLILECGIVDIVKYHGFLNSPQRNELFAQSDCYIQPSRFESFGLAILEAMSFGLPIITSKTGGIPDLVDNGVNGLFVTPGNKEEIYDAICYMMENPDRRLEMGCKSASKAEKFYIEAVEKALRDIYISVMNQSNLSTI